jgi:hypothetical protein
MTRSIFRLVLTTLALVTMFAGSFNVIRTRASADSIAADDDAAAVVAPSKCQELAGCPGGPTTCGTIQLPDGTTIRCGLQ